MGSILTILVSVLIFGVLILSHEFGHFIVARKCGVTVEEFAMGMGPVLWKKETADTTYTIRAFPIGGFCQMKGEEAEEDKEPEEGSFSAIKPFKKILVLAAGSAMNFLVAIILFFIIICMSGNVVTTTIDSVIADSPAMAAGMKSGDEIITVDGKDLEKWEDLGGMIDSRGGEDVLFTVRGEDGTIRSISVTPYLDTESGSYKVGIVPKVGTNVLLAAKQAVQFIGVYIGLIFDVFRQLFGGQIGMEAFSGPIGATVMIGQTISMGALYVLNIAASIAVSLGLFNLFPFPALDGSRIMFALIEWVKGSPVNPKWEGAVHTVGFVLLMGFAIFIAYKDIINLF
ncbi:MAG: site-2 protease family protein [Eubacteriaceae bacterium]|nr:site-2 protease family protein [Eubacteriaceae bacterium]